MNCAKAKKIDLIEYLASLGHYPAKPPHGDDYYYLSPLRDEHDPSFHVDRKKNVWYDHGGDKGGGTIIDFGIAYHRCTISEFLKMLEGYVSFHSPSRIIKEPIINSKKNSKKEGKIFVLSTSPIISPALVYYTHQRKIPIELAQLFCCEVKYKLYEKCYYAIGFKNDIDGYELRNPGFKGSSKPKGITFIGRGFKKVEVFEGFFSFLSFLVVTKNWQELPSNFLILNSLSFLNNSRELMEKHDMINLHLDRDEQGIKRAIELQSSCPKYWNVSVAYAGYKDWNKFLIADQTPGNKQQLKENPGRINRPNKRYLDNRKLLIPKKDAPG